METVYQVRLGYGTSTLGGRQVTKQAAVNLAARELVSHMLSLVPFFQPGPQLKKCPTCGLGWYPKKMLDLAPDLTFKLVAALDELEKDPP
jgi:hypothetical protein